MADNVKKFVFVPGEPIALNLEVDKLEVWVKTNEGEKIGFAKILPAAKDEGEEVCEITHFETSLRNDMLIDRMMLSGILMIAEYYNAKKIVARPHPVDFRAEGEIVLPVDVYERYKKYGFNFVEKDADITAPNQKMALNI